ncbi:hypothetical protein GH714_016000 [Hevea brasiliensis]|uniref:C-JID domain-containing protein n=1 Tax=Hevea brasiliensis TaxID=3981 RepID=A0A6A6KTW0_HEVBR|nr:hypothetical protein GH714_016000 [Hevea brasiliensis]
MLIPNCPWQDLMNLKQIGLCYSKYLTKIPDLSQAKNVESINLEGCKSLVELPSSIQYLHKLEYLNVRLCKSLRRLPSRIDSKLLRILDISHCPNVKYCPEVLENVVEFHLCRSGIKELPQSVHKLKALEIVWLIGCSNITKFPRVSMTVRELYLSETSIKEVPSSIEFLTGLEILEMISCNKLLRIPSTISKLKSLEILVLSHCSKLESFPEILEPMDSLACLYLDYCENLKRLPDSIYNLKSLEHLHLSGTAIQELPSSIEHLNCLKELKLDECKKLVSLPSSIHKVSQLRSIYLSYCKSLRALPELPLSLKVLEANGCRAMETFSSNRKSNFMNLSFTNCFKLDQKERSEIIENTTVQFLTSKFREYRDQVRILFQGNEIPECFHEQTMGTSLSIQLPPNWHQFQGIAFCIVFASEDPSIVCRISRFKCECHFRSNNKENEDIICNWVCFVDDLHLHEPDQVLLWYDPGIKALQGSGSAKEEDWFNKYSSASFQFYPQRWKKFQKHCKVKKCGVLLL